MFTDFVLRLYCAERDTGSGKAIYRNMKCLLQRLTLKQLANAQVS